MRSMLDSQLKAPLPVDAPKNNAKKKTGSKAKEEAMQEDSS
jgi:hypothetical protein